MTDLSELLSTEDLEHVRPRSHPSWVQPTLATLTHDPFSDPEWLYERKLDGERCLAFRDGDSVRFLTRNRRASRTRTRNSWTRWRPRTWRTWFSTARWSPSRGDRPASPGCRAGSSAATRNGPELAGSRSSTTCSTCCTVMGSISPVWACAPERTCCGATLHFTDPLRFSVHRVEHGEAMYREACRKGWEGVIAKRGDSPYRHGRSKDWLKFKCVREGDRHGLGALLVGYHDHGGLRYAGKVGTGFTAKVLAQLHDELSRISTDTSPFTDAQDVPHRGVHWVRPRAVAQIGFTEWTEAGRLRHPRYQGLRRDKDARDVVREQT